MLGPKRLPAAVLVDVFLQGAAYPAESRMRELSQLVESAGFLPCRQFCFPVRRMHPRTVIGAGHLQQVKQAVSEVQAHCVIFNGVLSPSQERNLSSEFCCTVADRTALILDIFAQRARTFEGKLQVELAQLTRLSTRLVRGWTHLERQKGGIGLRGPGETQLETDRRLLRNRVVALKGRLAQLGRQRDTRRCARTRSRVRTVALVGYTNAGKSSLFNALVGAGEALVADQLFATLDPTVRLLPGSHAWPIVLSDTVGFIRDLPHDVIEAFKSTLEESTHADVLLHVIDSSDADCAAKIASVEAVLAEIGAQDIPCIKVYNKRDLEPKAALLWGPAEALQGEHSLSHASDSVWVSAETGQGLACLKQRILELLDGEVQQWVLHVPLQAATLRAAVHRHQWCRAEQWVCETQDEAVGGYWRLVIGAPKGALWDILGPMGLADCIQPVLPP